MSISGSAAMLNLRVKDIVARCWLISCVYDSEYKLIMDLDRRRYLQKLLC